MNIEDQELEEVVQDGIRFVESLTRYYGAEKGMEVWNAMGEAVGREIKGKIFFAMMTGETGVRVRVSRGPLANNAVFCIKAIREATGAGLKEAKDLWDATSGGQSVKIDCRDVNHARELRKKLREGGMHVI